MKKLFATTVIALAAMANAFLAENTAYRPVSFGTDTGPDEEPAPEKPATKQAANATKKAKEQPKEKTKGYSLLLEANPHGASGVKGVVLFAGSTDEYCEQRPAIPGTTAILNQTNGKIHACIIQ